MHDARGDMQNSRCTFASHVCITVHALHLMCAVLQADTSLSCCCCSAGTGEAIEGGAKRAGRAAGAMSGAMSAVGAAAREDIEELSRQAGGAAGGLVEGGWLGCHEVCQSLLSVCLACSVAEQLSNASMEPAAVPLVLLLDLLHALPFCIHSRFIVTTSSEGS